MHVPKEERSKLDSKIKQCILLGHPDDEFGYRLWDPINRKIVRSRDVIFFEDETIEDVVRPKKQISTPRVVDLDSIRTPVVHDNHGEMIALKMSVQKLVRIRVMIKQLSIIW